MIGRTLARYEILDRLGEGGMGEVYLAVDRRLDRKIALKILPARLADDPQLVERFEREAKTAAALNHPNVVTLHSVEEVDGVRFLTMELVEGESLASKISEQGLPIDRFFELALPLVEAVAAAHDGGVTHRDLKPANVMVTDQGRVKVLDFGLAKLLEPADGTADLDSPTEALTRAGVVVGSVPYMSPEQVQGHAIDQRTDVFSLGILLSELLTGRRPFGGESSAEVISALLRDTPSSVDELRPEAPRHLAQILRRCLEKDPERRYRCARDLSIELERLKRETDNAHSPSQPSRAAPSEWPWSRLARVAVPVITAIILAALAREWRSDLQGAIDQGAPAALRLSKVTGGPGLENDPAWSPDGQFLAYTTDERGDLDIVVQPIGAGQPIRAFESPADEALPSWSPDGRRLAFVSARERGGRLRPGIGRGALSSYVIAGEGDLFVAPAFGGPAQRLAENAYDPDWSPDGRHIAFAAPGEESFDIWIVGSGGGDLRQLTFGEDAYHPAWSPDGSRIAFGAIDRLSGAFNLGVIPAGGGEPWLLCFRAGSQPVGPAWSPDGRVLYFSSNLSGRYNVWRVRAPVAAGDEFGEPRQVTFGGGADVGVSVDRSSGKLAFSSVSVDVSVWELELETTALRQVTFETGHEGNPQASPDGETLLVMTDRSGQPELWTYSPSGEPLARVGTSFSLDFPGVWSPDGRSVAYSRAGPEDTADVVAKELGSFNETLLLEGAFAGEWSPDGSRIAAARTRQDNPRYSDVVSISLADGGVQRLTFTDSANDFMTWSPDGSRIIFNSATGGTRKLWEVPSGGGDARPITFGDSEDSHPRWSPTDPDSVVFLRDHAVVCLLRPSTGEVRELDLDFGPHFGLDYPSWSADGTKLYFSVALKTGDIYVAEAE